MDTNKRREDKVRTKEEKRRARRERTRDTQKQKIEGGVRDASINRKKIQ